MRGWNSYRESKLGALTPFKVWECNSDHIKRDFFCLVLFFVLMFGLANLPSLSFLFEKGFHTAYVGLELTI